MESVANRWILIDRCCFSLVRLDEVDTTLVVVVEGQPRFVEIDIASDPTTGKESVCQRVSLAVEGVIVAVIASTSRWTSGVMSDFKFTSTLDVNGNWWMELIF